MAWLCEMAGCGSTMVLSVDGGVGSSSSVVAISSCAVSSTRLVSFHWAYSARPEPSSHSPVIAASRRLRSRRSRLQPSEVQSVAQATVRADQFGSQLATQAADDDFHGVALGLDAAGLEQRRADLLARQGVAGARGQAGQQRPFHGRERDLLSIEAGHLVLEI